MYIKLTLLDKGMGEVLSDVYINSNHIIAIKKALNGSYLKLPHTSSNKYAQDEWVLVRQSPEKILSTLQEDVV